MKTSIIVITAQAAIDNGVISAEMIDGDNYVIDGDFGVIASTKTLSEAIEIAKADAQATNSIFVVDV